MCTCFLDHISSELWLNCSSLLLLEILQILKGGVGLWGTNGKILLVCRKCDITLGTYVVWLKGDICIYFYEYKSVLKGNACIE